MLSSQRRAPLKIGIGLAIFQQVTSINAIAYYADTIFAAAGFTSVAGQTAATTWAIGGVNVLATLIAVAFVDRLGRKPLLVAGLIGMAVSLTVVGIAFMSIPDVATGVSSGANATGPSDAGIITLVALVVSTAAIWLFAVLCVMRLGWVWKGEHLKQAEGAGDEERANGHPDLQGGSVQAASILRGCLDEHGDTRAAMSVGLRPPRSPT